VNPLFGPRPETLLMLGAKSTWRIVERLEVWRLLAAVFLHGGLLHLLGNVAAILAYGRCVCPPTYMTSQRWRVQRNVCVRFLTVATFTNALSATCMSAI